LKRFRNEIGVGLLLMAALVALLYMSFKVGALKSLGDTIEVQVVFEHASGLVQDSDVRLAGVRIGGVDDLSVEDGLCLATLVIRRDAGLLKDTRAVIRARSVLGEKYVELQPMGDSAEPLADGDRITDSAIPYEIDQMVTAIGPLLEEVDPDDMKVIISTLADIARASDDVDVAALITETERLLDNLNTMAEIAPQVRQDVPVILTDLRNTTSQLDDTMDRMDRVLVRTETLIGRVDDSTTELPETMADVRAAAAELRSLAETLGDSEDELGPILEDLAAVLDRLAAVDDDEIHRLLREEGVRVRIGPPKPGKKKKKK